MPVITINGVNIEVPEQAQASAEPLRVGDPVKLLVKSQYSDPKVCAGVVAAFELFQTMPTITIAYVDPASYSGTGALVFAHLNEKSADKYELVHGLDRALLDIDQGRIQQLLQNDITKKQQELDEANQRLRFFNERFGAYFSRALEADLHAAA